MCNLALLGRWGSSRRYIRYILRIYIISLRCTYLGPKYFIWVCLDFWCVRRSVLCTCLLPRQVLCTSPKLLATVDWVLHIYADLYGVPVCSPVRGHRFIRCTNLPSIFNADFSPSLLLIFNAIHLYWLIAPLHYCIIALMHYWFTALHIHLHNRQVYLVACRNTSFYKSRVIKP